MLTRRKFLEEIVALTGAYALGRNRQSYADNSDAEELKKKGWVSDGLDHVISSDYIEREEQWEREKEFARNPKPFEKPVIVNGDVRIGNGEGVTGLTEETEEEPRLSVEFNIEDFKGVYNYGKWKLGLTDEEKRKAVKKYNGLNLDEKRELCKLYLSPYLFYSSRLNQEQQKKFDEFNNALRYLYSKTGRKGAVKSNSEIFSGKEFSEFLKSAYPWIRLDRNDIPLNAADRVLVFWVADYLETKKGKNIINWRNAEKYSKMKVED